MNFLAHIFLSGDNELVKIGNFMADGIRGNDYKTMLPEIQKGVILHRAIDTFTDIHPVFRQSTKRLHYRYHHYAGVIVDVFYDHFLASNWKMYSNESLESYVDAFYQSLNQNIYLLTPKTLNLMPYMIEHNWLVSYKDVSGIKRILSQMDHRTKYRSNMTYSVEELAEFYDDFKSEFYLFFEDLRTFVDEKSASL
ncbi:MAG TPA: acyl carrier protein phosphodiesterase [Flavobacterium sp.]|jgi:acyl carrier protein phosphodiesterase|nr:acyl carrier protein phosphodiesterase [Flavobacterium sp.]